MEPIEVRLLGRFSVRRGGEEIHPGALGGHLGRALLRILVTRRGAFVPHDALAEALWGDRPPADPPANLKVLVARLRRGLGDGLLIVTGPQGYSFAPDGQCVVDTELFLARLEAGRACLAQGLPDAALTELRGALALWIGDPLAEDVYADWAQTYRRRLARAHLEALELAATAALETGAHEEAVALAEAATVEEQLRESAHLLFVRALAASGNTAAALRAYQDYRRRLADDLGLDPSPEARALEARILRQEPLSRRNLERGAAYGKEMDGRPYVDELPFVGRDQEIAAALKILNSPHPGIVLVSGQAGAGKSRFLAEVATRTGMPAIYARAFLPEQAEEWALARSLLLEGLAFNPDSARSIPERGAQALAQILPDLDIEVTEGVIAPESHRALALEAAIRLLAAAASEGTMLVADDLQWADATSLSLVARAAIRVPRLGMILAYRPEDISLTDPMAPFLRQILSLPREVVSVLLGPLPFAALHELVADRDLSDVLAQATDRTPFAIAEVLRGLAAAGAIERDADGRWDAHTDEAVELARRAARDGHERAIQVRVDRLESSKGHLLKLLCLLRREAPARLLAIAMGADEARILEDVEALARTGLVRVGEAGWGPAHDLIAETVTQSLQTSERARLHAMVAQALQSQGGAAAELALHLSGAGDSEAAAEAYARAAGQSMKRYASAEAERLADEGLSLRPTQAVQADLLEIRAEARFRRGDLSGARDDLARAVPLKDVGPPRSRILSRMAMFASGSEDLRRADDLVTLALAEAKDEPDARAEGLFVGAIVDMNANRMDRADPRFDEALRLFEQSGNAQGIAAILAGRAMRIWLQGSIREAAEAFDRVAILFSTTGDLLRVLTPRTCRGGCLVQMARPEEGLSQVDEALELARMLGDVEGEDYGLIFRAHALSALDRWDEAVSCGKESLAIAERLGHREWTAASLWALGNAYESGGQYLEAEEAYRQSLQVCGDGLPFWASRAAARLASRRIVHADLQEAEALVARALSEGLPLSLYEARLARAHLAIARAEPDAATLSSEAIGLAEHGGYLAGVARFRRLVAGSVQAEARPF